MKIINDTEWDTRDLRKVALLVARRELDPHQIPPLVIHVRDRTGSIHGRATIGASSQEPATTSWVFLDAPSLIHANPRCSACAKDRLTHEGPPADPASVPGVDWLVQAMLGRMRGPAWTAHEFAAPEGTVMPGAEVAFIMAHEFQHNKGRRHREFAKRYREFDFALWSWAPDIRPKAKWRPSEPEGRV